MAAPGYPQQQQQQMGQHMTPPRGPVPPPGPMRRGTSRAVPVVVSAGLAVGVFCGLLFGLGVDKNDASAGPAKGNNVKQAGDGSGSAAGMVGLGATPALAPPTQGGSAVAPPPTPVAAVGSAGSAAPTVVAPKTLTLTVEITPDAAAAIAKIVVDGKEITGKTAELPVDTKSVKLAVTANGYRPIEKKVDLAADSDTKIKFEMAKRATGTASPGFGGASSVGNHVPTAPPGTRPHKPQSGGIIDL